MFSAEFLSESLFSPFQKVPFWFGFLSKICDLLSDGGLIAAKQKLDPYN